MKFICTTDCYSNIIGKGFRMGNVYDITDEEAKAMKGTAEKPGHFPRRFEPADMEAKNYLKPAPKKEPEAMKPEAQKPEPAKIAPKR